MGETPVRTVYSSDKEIADNLRSYWESYMRVVDLTITLATGSFLVFANIAFSDKMILRIQQASQATKSTGVVAAIILGLGILSATLWRMLSLTWMEIECIGQREEANAYLQRVGVEGPHIYAFQTGPTRLKRRLWTFFKYAAAACILVSWLLLFVFGIAIYSVQLPGPLP